MKKHFSFLIFIQGIFLLAYSIPSFLVAQIRIPQLPDSIENKIQIDGNPEEWKDWAFYDGVWNMARVRNSPWYDGNRNRLTDHGDEPSEDEDLSAKYYLAWTKSGLYFSAIVTDNRNDVSESKHEPKRWYYKDAVALFIEAPGDTMNEKFGDGDHCFAFIADSTYPDYGAWWRHGTRDTSYIEESALKNVDYKLKFNPEKESPGNYTLEAKINWYAFKRRDYNFFHYIFHDIENLSPRFMIVHCDPDGGEYGGHMLVYGKGDEDNTWTTAILISDSSLPPIRKIK